MNAKDSWNELTGRLLTDLGGKQEMDEEDYSLFITKTLGLP